MAWEGTLILFFLGGIMISPIVYLIVQNILLNRWKRGVFPSWYKSDTDNILRAYICLSGVILCADRESSKEKLAYMHVYFRDYFEDEVLDLPASLKFAYDHPIQLKSIAKWMRIKFSHRQRTQVMYFLTGLAYVDGFMNSRETKVMQELKELLQISDKEYQSIIGMYEQKREREKKQRSQPTESTRARMIRISCQILGVSEYATALEIKKAYRSLVKKHHPDRFALESGQQKEIAKEKFMEVQKAYEVLEESGKV